MRTCAYGGPIGPFIKPSRSQRQKQKSVSYTISATANGIFLNSAGYSKRSCPVTTLSKISWWNSIFRTSDAKACGSTPGGSFSIATEAVGSYSRLRASRSALCAQDKPVTRMSKSSGETGALYRMRAFNRSVNSLRLIFSGVSLTPGGVGDDKRPVTLPPSTLAQNSPQTLMK